MNLYDVRTREDLGAYYAQHGLTNNDAKISHLNWIMNIKTTKDEDGDLEEDLLRLEQEFLQGIWRVLSHMKTHEVRSPEDLKRYYYQQGLMSDSARKEHLYKEIYGDPTRNLTQFARMMLAELEDEFLRGNQMIV